MTQKEKDLLLRDLCMRLPYVVVAAVPHYDENGKEILLQGKITGLNNGQLKFEYLPDCTDDIGAYNWFDFDLVKPYLRPLSSMTEEEEEERQELWHSSFSPTEYSTLFLDFCNERHLDYRGLIKRGCAIAVTEENNPYKV